MLSVRIDIFFGGLAIGGRYEGATRLLVISYFFIWVLVPQSVFTLKVQ